MGLFSSGPNFNDRVERLLEIAETGSNDGKRRDALDKLARADKGSKALQIVADNSRNEDWIRRAAVEKLEYCRGVEELEQLAGNSRTDEDIALKAVDVLGSLGASDALGNLTNARGPSDRVKDRAFEYL